MIDMGIVRRRSTNQLLAAGRANLTCSSKPNPFHKAGQSHRLKMPRQFLCLCLVSRQLTGGGVQRRAPREYNIAMEIVLSVGLLVALLCALVIWRRQGCCDLASGKPLDKRIGFDDDEIGYFVRDCAVQSFVCCLENYSIVVWCQRYPQRTQRTTLPRC
jgi:hypothetical protein